MSLAEHSALPRCFLVHDPVEAGGFDGMRRVEDPASLERDWLFREPPGEALYREQHRALVAALERHVPVRYLSDLVAGTEAYAATRANPNQVFTRDSVVTLPWAPDVYLPARMERPQRRGETAVLREALERFGLREILEIPEPLFLEGGDVIPFERAGRRTLLIGHGPRTSLETVGFLQEALLPEYADEILAIHLAPWRMNLDGGFVPVAPDLILAESASLLGACLLDSRSRQDVVLADVLRDLGARVIEVTRRESIFAQACNCAAVGPRRLVYYDLCPRVATELRRAGVEVILVPGSELVKGRGGPRCMTRPIYGGLG